MESAKAKVTKEQVMGAIYYSGVSHATTEITKLIFDPAKNPPFNDVSGETIWNAIQDILENAAKGMD